MIAQMSSKSRIYHRPGCRFINRIEEKSLISFDMDDGRIKYLKPCKCCCNIKFLYNEYRENLKDVFRDLPIWTELRDDYIGVHTDWYNWRIGLSESSQEIRLYLEEWNEEFQKDLLIRVDEAGGSKNLKKATRYIAKEERVAFYSCKYRKYALGIECLAKKRGVQIEFDDTDLYILTDMAAWKISYVQYFDRYKLLHCPFDGKPLTMEEAKTAHYHVQRDVVKNQSPYNHLEYIVKHDEAKKLMQISYKKLPKVTKQQKKYYRQAENREKRNSIRRVWNLFAELEAGKVRYANRMD
mgnify:FL=1